MSTVTELQAVRAQLDALQAEVDELRSAVVFTTALADLIDGRAYDRGRASVLGRQADPGHSRPRHLRAVR